ncbi:MAG: hypothetical protein EAZ17_10055, partial [Sphingobacteriales bacterium]
MRELEYLFARSGIVQLDGTYAGLDAKDLPDFFHDLAAERGDKANTRSFVEQYRVLHYPLNAVQYEFLFSTQLIKDLKSLSFGGEDNIFLYASRHRGLSIFSLAPISESNLSMSMDLLQPMLQYELAESNHGPAEALEMAKLSSAWGSFPGGQPETLLWVDHI